MHLGLILPTHITIVNIYRALFQYIIAKDILYKVVTTKYIYRHSEVGLHD